MIDVCGAGAHSGMIVEGCDGTDIGSAHCEISGTVGCTASCQLDTTGCEICEALSPPVVSCGTAPGDARAPTAVAIAGTDAEIGLAWVEGGGGATARTLRFARLSPTLGLLSNFALGDVCDNFGVGRAGLPSTELAVAPLPSGWVVVGESDGVRKLDVYAIDAQGRPTAKTTISTNIAAPENHVDPLFAPRPGGAPLLVWSSLSDIRATIVAADGRSVAPSFALPLGGVPSSNTGGATFIGDSFYVATSVTPPTGDPGQLRIARIQPDTGNVSVVPALPGQIVIDVGVVEGAPDLQLLYGNADLSVLNWQRFDTTGVAASPPLPVLRRLTSTSAVAFAGGAFILAFKDPGWNVPGIQTVTAQGQIGTMFQPLARSGVSWAGVARRGPDAIAAWIGGNNHVSIARLTP